MYFTSYAEQKFAILNDHGVFIRKEEIEAALTMPDKRGKIGSCLTAQKENIKVVYKKEGEIKKIITFYPI